MATRKKRRMVDTSVPEEDEEVGPSRADKRKVRRKKQDRLEALGKRLTELSDPALAKLELGDAVEREVKMLATLGLGSALARQRRRVAAVLREFDLKELERRVEETLGAFQPSQASTLRLERLRRDLLDPEGDALTRIFEEHHDLDRPLLHQAVRAARKEAAAGEPSRRYRELFQVLKKMGLGIAPADPADPDDSLT